MSKYIDIKGKKYIYEVNYKENETFRKSFSDLAEKSFGIKFEDWYEEGYWGDGYVPYSLLDDDKLMFPILSHA